MLRWLTAGFLLGALLNFAAPTSEFIYNQAPFPSCHASTLVETKNGDLLAAWFGGTKEGAPDVAIWAARKTAGKWSAPFELVREPKIAAYNPVLFRSRDGIVWMYYKFGDDPTRWTGGRIWSKDEGKTWSQPEHLPAGLYGPIKNKPLVLNDGTIVSGTSVESYRAWTSWVERSGDGGKTWTKHGPVVYPGQPYGTIQPAIVPLPGNRIRMFVRTRPTIGKIAYADSTDGGKSWTELRPTELPNPNSGIDAVALRDGRLVMVYNHTSEGRTPLNLAVSRDGLKWNNFLALETAPGEFSYPAIIQTSDGAIHVTYTWNREKIKHLEVQLKDIPN